MSLEIELVRTQGIFSLEGEDFEVENNIWLLCDGDRLLVVDAAHDAEAIIDQIGGRRTLAIVCTHGHNDHINAAVALSEAVHAPIALHADDQPLWAMVYPDRSPDLALSDGDRLDLGDNRLRVLHTPGHSPGGVCLVLDGARTVFSGDTLFRGGPGATGRAFSDFGTIIDSIRARLLTLPADTVVHTGHGDDTTIGDELPHLDDWIARGH